MNAVPRRAKKQLQIAAVTAGAICLVVGGLLIVRRATDERAHVLIRYANEEGSNQDEQGIAPLAIEGQYRFEVPDGHQFVAVLRNPNEGWHASRVSYRVAVVDASGEQTKELEGESFVPAGDSRLILQGFSDEGFVPEHFSVTIESIDWVDVVGREIPAIRVRHAVFESTAERAMVTGSAVNDSQVSVADVEVGVLALNAAGEPVGVGIATIDSLGAGRQEGLSVAWEGGLEEVSTLSFFPIAESVRKSF